MCRWESVLIHVLFLVFLTAAIGEDTGRRTPEQIDKDLRRLASELGRGSMGGYRWPKEFSLAIFQTSEDGVYSKASIFCDGEDDVTFKRCLLIVGEAYGILFHEGVTMTIVVVNFKTPKGTSFIQLPLKESKDLGDALLAEPQDEEKVRAAILTYTAAVRRQH